MRSRCALPAAALLFVACSDPPEELPGVVAVSDGRLDDDLRAPITTCFRFDGADALAAAYGPGQLAPYDPDSTRWATGAVQAGTTSSFGLPPLPDGPAPVLHLPALTPDEGLVLRHGTGGNGDFARHGRESRYTLVFDVFYPPGATGRTRALYQTDATNRGAGEFFVSPHGGLGVDGGFQGNVDDGRWHRIAVVVRADRSQGQLQKYVDGSFVGAQGEGGAAIDDRWALGPTLLLFTDGDGATGEVYVASILFIGEALLMDEVRALGGPTAAGACTPGAPAAPWPVTLPRTAGIFGHKGDACCAPENTLTAIRQALDKGATFIEIDLQRTADGVAVALHDDTVDRTTDGSGPVGHFALARLRTLDAGRWFHPLFAGERIPTLAEVLTLCKGRARVYLDGVHGNGAAIARALREAGVGPEAVWPWALDERDLDELRWNIPGVEILYGSVDGWTRPGFFEELGSRGVTGFSIPWQSLTPELARAVHAQGMYLEVYTVFDPDRMNAVISAGADGMETDYPGVLDALEPQLLRAPCLIQRRTTSRVATSSTSGY